MLRVHDKCAGNLQGFVLSVGDLPRADGRAVQCATSYGFGAACAHGGGHRESGVLCVRDGTLAARVPAIRRVLRAAADTGGRVLPLCSRVYVGRVLQGRAHRYRQQLVSEEVREMRALSFCVVCVLHVSDCRPWICHAYRGATHQRCHARSDGRRRQQKSTDDELVPPVQSAQTFSGAPLQLLRSLRIEDGYVLFCVIRASIYMYALITVIVCMAHRSSLSVGRQLRR